MASTFRISPDSRWPADQIDKIHNSDALKLLKRLPDSCVALIVTSPPYWDLVDYGVAGQIGQSTYEEYIAKMLEVWKEAARVLIPNGKLAIVTPIIPISKSVISDQHTRHLKNISNDIEHSILSSINQLERYSLFVWQKQTSVKMFGSYPFPPNIYEDNTVEFINVFVKQGAPPAVNADVKERSRMTQQEWRNLTMQVWPVYPEDVKRVGHPAPFPLAIPLRLTKMYTFRAAPDLGFEGDIVLDMFAGTGSTCVAARALGRRWIGIELNPDFCKLARKRVQFEDVDGSAILLEPVKVKGAKSTIQPSLFPVSDEAEGASDGV